MAILVLEDSLDRVEWLRKHMPETQLVLHATSVVDFEAKLGETKGKLDLIILDHDLGHAPPTPYVVDSDSYDENGQTGYDAALAVPHDIACPVLVWSMNHSAAKRMYEALVERGIVAALLPFGAPTLASALHYLVR